VASDRREISLNLDEPLRDSPRRTTSMSLPIAVHHRLDVLAKLAASMNATRAEIIGMLVADCQADAGYLEQRILTYRKMLVSDVVPSPDSHRDEGNVVVLPLRRPGRPATR
jgi:hypothetical protein